MTLERGSLLNKRYRIVEILGQGGMAAVYRAIDENLGVEVAVKENLFTTEEYARQFHREAKILANLRHPNLPLVTDHFFIEQQGQYLVMDYIEGEDLRQRMERVGPLPDQEVIILGAALCDALSYLHTRNPQVLHRDIKPGNVKITPDGQIRLVDFGLAKVVSGRTPTTTGARAMTPGYSPPEQYGTARTDHRSDIYSLGATLYSALTDAIPEDGLARAMEQANLTQVVKRNPKVSKRLATVIEKAMEVRPEDRYQSAEEFKNELLNASSATRRRLPADLTLGPSQANDNNGEMSGVRPASKPIIALEREGPGIPTLSFPISTPEEAVFRADSRPRSRFNWVRSFWLLLTVIVMLMTGLAYSAFPQVPKQALSQVQGFIAMLMTPRPPGSTGGVLTSTSTVAPSARAIIEPGASATATPTRHVLATQTLTLLPSATRTATPSPTVKPSPTALPTVLGGGIGQIAFASDRTGIPEIWLMNSDGTGLVQLTNRQEGACQPAWDPNGNRLAFISPCERNREIYQASSIFLINVDGTGLTQLPYLPGGDFDPAWSPDGKYIAFSSLRNSEFPQIHIMNLEDSSVKVLPDDPPRANSHPQWSPDGKYIVYVGGDNQIRVMDIEGKNRFLLSRNAGGFKNTEPVFSPDGLSVVFTQSSLDMSNSWLMGVQFKPEGSLPVKIHGADYMTKATFSPDGFWLAASGYPAANHNIFIMTVNGVGYQDLTPDPSYDFDPAWRPGAAQP